jgi:hypothetical protein
MESYFKKLEGISTKAGAAGIAALALSYFVWPDHFLQSYLYGYLLWLGLTLGCLGILLLHHLVSGAWGHIIQRMAESGTRNLALMGLLFVPILLGMKELYPWTDPAVVASSHVIQEKTAYLNTTFWVIRAVVFFLFWTGVGMLLRKWSAKQDAKPDASLTRTMKIFSGPVMVLFVLTATLASVDWMMSLEPEWYSTIYGMSFIVGAVLTAFAFLIVILAEVARYRPYSDILTSRHAHHLGNLLFAFTILWAYLAFSQYLIIWSGNLPDDNAWYLRRTETQWTIVSAALLVGHFFVPFFILLSRKTKRVLGRLKYIALFIFAMRLVDIFWLTAPAFDASSVHVHVLDIIAPVAIGGVWVALFARWLKTVPILPLNDPRFGPDGFHIHDLD